MPHVKIEVMPEPWESVQHMEGKYLGFDFIILRLGHGAWRALANRRGNPLEIRHIVKDSPGEALCAMAEAIRDVIEKEDGQTKK